MNLKDEDLKRLYRSYVGKRADLGRRDCPSLRELSEFFEPRMSRREKMKIVDHVTGCAACAEEFEILRDLQRGQDQIIRSAVEIWASKSPSQRTSSASGGIGAFWRYCSVAAGAFMVIASLIVIVRKGTQPGQTRAAPNSVNLIYPGQSQAVSVPLVFRWKEFKGADTYVLELFDEALLRIWTSPKTTSPYIDLSGDGIKKLQVNGPYFWMVTAFRAGDKLSESELARFILVDKGP